VSRTAVIALHCLHPTHGHHIAFTSARVMWKTYRILYCQYAILKKQCKWENTGWLSRPASQAPCFTSSRVAACLLLCRHGEVGPLIWSALEAQPQPRKNAEKIGHVPKKKNFAETRLSWTGELDRMALEVKRACTTLLVVEHIKLDVRCNNCFFQ
jgi:hypothetical protein